MRNEGAESPLAVSIPGGPLKFEQADALAAKAASATWPTARVPLIFRSPPGGTPVNLFSHINVKKSITINIFLDPEQAGLIVDTSWHI
jgi:hypothetical protein